MFDKKKTRAFLTSVLGDDYIMSQLEDENGVVFEVRAMANVDGVHTRVKITITKGFDDAETNK